LLISHAQGEPILVILPLHPAANVYVLCAVCDAAQ